VHCDECDEPQDIRIRIVSVLLEKSREVCADFKMEFILMVRFSPLRCFSVRFEFVPHISAAMSLCPSAGALQPSPYLNGLSG